MHPFISLSSLNVSVCYEIRKQKWHNKLFCLVLLFISRNWEMRSWRKKWLLICFRYRWNSLSLPIPPSLSLSPSLTPFLFLPLTNNNCSGHVEPKHSVCSPCALTLSVCYWKTWSKHFPFILLRSTMILYPKCFSLLF